MYIGAAIAVVTVILFAGVCYALIKLGGAKEKNEQADKLLRELMDAKRAKDSVINGSDEFNRVRDKYSRK